MGYSEIGYMLSESHQGRGLGTAAVSLFVAKIFRESSLDRLFATISVENAASIRLVTRLGFTREGLLREHFLIEGRRVDELVYGILRREWSPPDPIRAP
jgi:ribosomal-protein-alanine N-acetyltransferase